MHQGRGLERLPRPLAGQAGAGELAQLVIDQGQEFSGRLPVAALDVGEDPGHVAHGSGAPLVWASRRRGPALQQYIDGPGSSEVTA